MAGVSCSRSSSSVSNSILSGFERSDTPIVILLYSFSVSAGNLGSEKAAACALCNKSFIRGLCAIIEPMQPRKIPSSSRVTKDAPYSSNTQS